MTDWSDWADWADRATGWLAWRLRGIQKQRHWKAAADTFKVAEVVGECWPSQGLQISLAYYFAIGALTVLELTHRFTSLLLGPGLPRAQSVRHSYGWQHERDLIIPQCWRSEQLLPSSNNKEAHKCGHPLASEKQTGTRVPKHNALPWSKISTTTKLCISTCLHR